MPRKGALAAALCRGKAASAEIDKTPKPEDDARKTKIVIHPADNGRTSTEAVSAS